ncbi:hypothetical protein [Gulosibacter molinativorax]|uniref:Antirestriction protein ArdA n=1 Tax=Gulosibacter molinativorax TaxID=256821 RepID=A0ABT7CBX2_9MICO|nr:hypothetical protein [Gulosibacter molinativorax]MDJ1372662.1 hypothetical protein [Gulosibacter molinativorax]QUY62398.1 Hypotetical protein [Gulosibacter molinativorax]
MERPFIAQPSETSPDEAADATTPNGQIAPMWLSQRIDHATTEALTRHREISHEEARDIAGALAIGLPEDSRVAEFAVSGIGVNESLRDEYLSLYHDPATNHDVRRWINWLGSWLVSEDNTAVGYPSERELGRPPDLHDLLWTTTLNVDQTIVQANVRADLPTEQIHQLENSLTPLLMEHGDAFAAYLSLADVDAGSPDCHAGFDSVYEGSFTTKEEAMHALTELTDWESELRRLVQRSGVDGLVTMNYDVLWDYLELFACDAVALGGRLHIFAK